MAIPSFYHPTLRLDDELISLDSGEGSHAVKSRRLRVNQKVRVFNGSGLVASGNLATIDRRNVTVHLETIDSLERPSQRLSIAVAIPKGDRQKVMVDMLTQLGVFEIIPLRCERSVTKSSENTYERWKRVAIEACKQSQNPWLPVISNQQDIEQLLHSEQRNLAFANTDGAYPDTLKASASDITVLIGPEGGFSDTELIKLRDASIPSIKIGPYILRTETAAVAVASAFISES